MEIHKVYRVLSDPEAEKHGDLRLSDESGEDYLFPAAYFVLIQPPAGAVCVLNQTYARPLAG